MNFFLLSLVVVACVAESAPLESTLAYDKANPGGLTEQVIKQSVNGIFLFNFFFSFFFSSFLFLSINFYLFLFSC